MTRRTNHDWIVEHKDYQGDDCLKWPFFIDPSWGRGKCGYKAKVWWAHNLMCTVAHGPAPADRPQAMHSCGNGHLGCVNPRHLSWGTNSENAYDRRRHGRPEGSKGGRTDLTPEQVAEIQTGRKTQLALAAKFGVSRSCIQYWQGMDRGPRPWSTRRSAELQRKRQPMPQSTSCQ